MQQPVTKRATDYLKIRADLSESTVNIFNRAVDRFIECLGDMDIVDIRFCHIDDYKRFILNGRSPATANLYLSLLKSFFNWLARRRYIESSPFDGITLYKTAKKKFDIYTIDEVRRILEIADSTWRLIICLGLLGMRQSEILNLIISDIDFERSRIKITPKADTKNTWRWTIKNYQEAFIGLDESILGMLIVRSEKLGDCPYVSIKESYWRRNLRLRDQGKLTYDLRQRPWGNFCRDYYRLLERACVRRKRFHDLRGTFATERFKAGYDIKEIQYLMRHSSITTTAIYLRNVKEEQLVQRSAKTFEKYYVTK